MAMVAIGVIAFVLVNDSNPAADEAATDVAPADGQSQDGEPATGSTADGETSGATTVPLAAAPSPAPIAPYVQATLSGPNLALSGSVSDPALVEDLSQAATLVYAPFVQSELQFDDGLPEAPWLAAARPAIMLLQTITEGTITISEGTIAVEGRAASAEDVALLEARLIEATGLPVQLGDIEVTNHREAVYVIAGSDGQLALSGALPSEEIRMGLVEAGTVIYGPENVLDASIVDEGVATTLWMYNPEGLLVTLAQFPEFEVRLDGGAFSASLSGGSIFPTDSTDISPEFAQVLNFGAVVLTRDPSMTITIEGHTDDAGSDQYNLALSQARADAVADYFIGAGISPDRVIALGVGEAEPAAPNDTEEGKSRNRRVEFTLASDS